MSFVRHYSDGGRKQNWATPATLFREMHLRFRFTLDGASTEQNKLLARGSTVAYPVAWTGERVFCNPPWDSIAEFVERATTAELAVLLVPARVNAKWFHRALELGARVEFFKGRPRFGDGSGSSPFDCLFLLFGATDWATRI